MHFSVEEEFEACEKANDELLISLVKDRPCLFDKSSKDYKDNVVVENSWVEISSLMHDSVDSCKKRWKKLKSCYQKELELKDKENRSGSGASTRSQWPFFKDMQSLFSKSASRISRSNLLDSPTDDLNKIKTSRQTKFVRNKTTDNFLVQTVQKAESVFNSLASTVDNIITSRQPIQDNNTPFGRKEKNACSDNLDDLVGRVISAKLNQLNSTDAKKKRKEITRFLANFESDSDDNHSDD